MPADADALGNDPGSVIDAGEACALDRGVGRDGARATHPDP